MKQKLFTKILALISLFSMNIFNMNAGTTPDFNYPKTVSTNALADLKKAEKSGDKTQLCDALIRYSVAQTLISNDNAQECINKIEHYRQKETAADYAAILAMLEADFYTGLSQNTYGDRKEKHDTYPADLSEWNSDDFNKRITELYDEAFSKIEQLRTFPITKYQPIIKADSKYFPSLLDFAYSKRIESRLNGDNTKSLLSQWADFHKGDVAPSIYLAIKNIENANLNVADSEKQFLKLYKQYSQFMESGMALNEIGYSTYGIDSDAIHEDTSTDHQSQVLECYRLFKDYVARFPKSPFTPAIRAKIYFIEQKSVNVFAEEHYVSQNDISLTANVQNVNDYTIGIYTVTKSKNGDNIPNKLVKKYTYHADGDSIFYKSQIKHTIDKLPYGEYLFVPSFVVTGKQQQPKYGLNATTITDICSFLIADNTGQYIYVIHRGTGAPLAGVKVSYKTSKRQKSLLGTTDANGMIKMPSSLDGTYANFFFEKGNDTKYTQRYNIRSYNNSTDKALSAEIFTDLAVYRPGETMKYSVLLFQCDDFIKSPAKGEKLSIEFVDSNYKTVAKDTLSTDDMGRINGEFKIPTDRMNGSFSLVISKHGLYQRKYINVSEYKTPSFFVSFDDARRSYNKNEDVTLCGKAQTYAGMPVANAPVAFSITKSQWFYWMNIDDNFLKQDTVTTNAKGEFTITLPRDMFDENTNSRERRIANIYSVEASCTNNIGETQSCNHNFFIGSHRKISIGSETTFINNRPITLPVSIESSDPDDKNFTCNYTVTTTDSTVVAKGTFRSDAPKIDLTALPSGQYIITVADASGLAKEDSSIIILYKESDKQCPVESVLWVPTCGRKTGDDNVARITVGTTEPDTHIFCLTESNKSVTKQWIQLSKGLHTVNLPMPTGENEEMKVRFIVVRDGKQYKEGFSVISPKRSVKAQVETVTFRDKLTPGAKEKWTFRLIDNHGTPLKGAALLAMTDKAINSISSNIWCNYKPHFYSHSLIQSLELEHSYDYNTSANWTYPYSYRTNFTLNDPCFNYYGYDPADHNSFIAYGTSLMARGGKQRMMLMSKHEEAIVEEKMMAEPAAAFLGDEEGESDAANDSGAQMEDLSNITLRESDVKTALWIPNTTTDDKGYYTVEFEVPNFNTTWIMQTLAYSVDGLFGGIQRDVITSRPLMVKANMPRFLRSGDQVTLAANVANKSDEAVQYNGVIELFDPRTDKVIATKEFDGQLAAMSDTAVTINYNVPANANFIGFRIKAATKGCGDGEQVMVPILSDVSPVIETMPFYIDANNNDFTGELPRMDRALKVTLEYCDNPVWYCATALPTILDDDARTSTSLVHSLFALSLAQGLAKQNPQFAEAITYWQKQDSTQSPLVSALARNSDLKIGSLLASPWINEADRQTLRMSKLAELFNETYCTENIGKIVTKLLDLQMPNGGFAWIKCNDCKSSLYCTGTVLEFIARTRHLGYTISDNRIDNMISRAMKYYDAEHLKIFTDKKHKPYWLAYSDYAYVRTMYPEIAIPHENRKYISKIISAIKEEWKGQPIAEKAFYALTLHNNGEDKTARQITESIRQFSITTPTRGMYWDAISPNWWRGNNRLATTAIILQALNEVDNRTNEIDQIRKWILLNKQTNDWGGTSLASEAVYSILATGSKWLTNGTAPTITIGGEQIAFSDIDRFLGYARKDVTLSDVMGKDITIYRGQSTSPAWGALYMQGEATMKEIKSAKVDDLSIEKSLLVYGSDGKLSKAKNLKVGDKVRVQCTIKCGKSLEYLTLTDERGACFEPVDKLSGYDYIDGVWMYRETKDSQTNIFIPGIDKGTYVIGYDVYVTNPGKFNVGIATIQCQYAPQFTAHSAGNTATVK